MKPVHLGKSFHLENCLHVKKHFHVWLCPVISKQHCEAGCVATDSWMRNENKSSKVGPLVPYSGVLCYTLQPLWRRTFRRSPNLSGAWNKSEHGGPPITWLNIWKSSIRRTGSLKKIVFNSYLNKYTLIMTKLKNSVFHETENWLFFPQLFILY